VALIIKGEPANPLMPSPFQVTILSPKNDRSDLRDPDLIYTWDICNV